jgi:hypothetical protein
MSDEGPGTGKTAASPAPDDPERPWSEILFKTHARISHPPDWEMWSLVALVIIGTTVLSHDDAARFILHAFEAWDVKEATWATTVLMPLAFAMILLARRIGRYGEKLAREFSTAWEVARLMLESSEEPMRVHGARLYAGLSGQLEVARRRMEIVSGCLFFSAGMALVITGTLIYLTRKAAYDPRWLIHAACVAAAALVAALWPAVAIQRNMDKLPDREVLHDGVKAHHHSLFRR